MKVVAQRGASVFLVDVDRPFESGNPKLNGIPQGVMVDLGQDPPWVSKRILPVDSFVKDAYWKTPNVDPRTEARIFAVARTRLGPK